MKATARKIKDNEWISEVEDWGQDNRNYYGTNQHPIVSPSDKEWLEKNNMDGKEVEGDLHVPNPTSNAQIYFYLTTPPIHSDPANGGKYADLQMQMEHRGPYSDPAREEDKLITIKCTNCGNDAFERKSHLDDKRTALCGKCKRDNLLNLISPGSAPTPQTGRTYTEGEVEDILLFYYNSSNLDFVELGAKGIIDEYLKQNPKP